MRIYALKRLKEPSTWVAIGGVLTALGLGDVTPEAWGSVGEAIGVICMTVGAVLGEPGNGAEVADG